MNRIALPTNPFEYRDIGHRRGSSRRGAWIVIGFFIPITPKSSSGPRSPLLRETLARRIVREVPGAFGVKCDIVTDRFPHLPKRNAPPYPAIQALA
jgi:hypothetical protein